MSINRWFLKEPAKRSILHFQASRAQQAHKVHTESIQDYLSSMEFGLRKAPLLNARCEPAEGHDGIAFL